MSNKKFVFSFAALAIMVALSAQSAIAAKIHSNYWGRASGAHAPEDQFSDKTVSAGAYNSIRLEYEATPGFSPYANMRWEFNTQLTDKTGTFTWYNWRFGVKTPKLVDTSQFYVWAKWDLEFGTAPQTKAEELKDGKLIIGPGGWSVSEYSFSDSPFSVGTEFDWRMKFFSNRSKDALVVNVAPFVAVKLSDIATAKLYYIDEFKFQPYTSSTSSITTFIRPHFVLKANDSLSFEPFVAINTQTVSASYVGIDISGTFF